MLTLFNINKDLLVNLYFIRIVFNNYDIYNNFEHNFVSKNIIIYFLERIYKTFE